MYFSPTGGADLKAESCCVLSWRLPSFAFHHLGIHVLKLSDNYHDVSSLFFSSFSSLLFDFGS
jgi:hypothetical protein